MDALPSLWIINENYINQRGITKTSLKRSLQFSMKDKSEILPLQKESNAYFRTY